MKKIKQLNFQQSKYLVERTGLGVEIDVIDTLVDQSLDSAINQIFANDTNTNVTNLKLLKPSVWASTRKTFIKNNERPEIGKLYRKEREAFKQWGLQNLLESNNPFYERMVWFWQNHFTSSVQNVRPVAWMMQREQSIRIHALGDFSSFLKTMSFDPAMLIYLNGKSNRKGKPNENFARELLELFTLGEGNYSENDIKEAARAFTGWRVNNGKDKIIFSKKHHDDGVKTFMGHSGKFNGEDILDILLENPRTAEFISEKLWYEFVSTSPPEPVFIKNWAKVFIDSKYDISILLKTIFKSDAFWDEKYQGTLIKSPIDLVAGTLRTFDLEDNDLNLKVFVKQLKLMGQDLYSPPNVKGWEGGKTWIDDDKLLRRQSFLQRIMRGQAGANKKKSIRKNSANNMEKTSMSETTMSETTMSKSKNKKNGMNIGSYKLPELSEQQWTEWLLPIPPITSVKRKSKKARLRAIVLDPAYQLK